MMIDVERVLLSLDISLTAQRGDEVQGYELALQAAIARLQK